MATVIVRRLVANPPSWPWSRAAKPVLLCVKPNGHAVRSALHEYCDDIYEQRVHIDNPQHCMFSTESIHSATKVSMKCALQHVETLLLT